jgi:hypothetical protein
MFKAIRYSRLFLTAAWVFIPMTAYTHEISAPATAAQMVRAANALFYALAPGQQKAAWLAFEDDERFNWHYVPRSRAGLPLKDMTEDQRRLALQFLAVGLSQSGYLKATNIMALETVLRENETWNWLGRDPEKYFFSFFGQPSETGTWGWRVEGHHLSLNIYYRIQGPTFIIEYDNVQNDANHIHTVWRDFDGDFGRDLLRAHYRKAHQ